MNEYREQSPKQNFSDGASSTHFETPNDTILNEAQKIIQFGLEKDYALSEKDKLIQDAAEVVENLRKNIIQIQLDYEKLDQKFAKEVLYRSELVKRTEITRKLVDTASEFSNILATSIKEMESDKSEIAEFCNQIYQRQEEIKESRKKIEVIVHEQDELIKDKVLRLTESNKELCGEISVLNEKLYQTEAKFKCETLKKLDLEKKIGEIEEELNQIQTTLMMEQSEKHRCQIIKSQLKKNFMRHKMKAIKKLNSRSLAYNKKIKKLKFKIGDMENTLQQLQKSNSDLLCSNESLKTKSQDDEREYTKIRENYIQEIQDLKDLLELYSKEKLECNSRSNQLEKDLKEERQARKIVDQNFESLENNYKLQLLGLREKERDVKILSDENSYFRKKIDEMRDELQQKIEAIDNLDKNIRILKSDTSAEKCGVLENELLECREAKKELQNQIDLLRETAEKERSDQMQISFEKEMCINKLMNDLKNVEEQKYMTESELHQVQIEYDRVRNEMKQKSVTVEKLRYKLEVKLRAESRMEEAWRSLKLKEEKLQMEVLSKRIQELEKERLDLESNFQTKLEEEKSYSQALQLEKSASERTVKKLVKELEEAKHLLETETKKRKLADEEIHELRKLSGKCIANEETIANLTTSLKSAEASVETYKFIIKKLEKEATERKKLEDEPRKNLRSELSQSESTSERKERSEKISEASKENMETVYKSGAEHKESDFTNSGSSISTSHKLFSTPRQFIQDNALSRRFKTATTPREKRDKDPYEFDSDSSVERLDFNQVLKELKNTGKKGSASKKRRAF